MKTKSIVFSLAAGLLFAIGCSQKESVQEQKEDVKDKSSSITAPLFSQKISIESFDVKYPSAQQFRVEVKSSSAGVNIGSYSIRSTEKFTSNIAMPGWIIAPSGYAGPEKVSIANIGDTDNGNFDEDGASNSYVRTFSVEGWKSGIYTFLLQVQNRPPWVGPIIYDCRKFTFSIDKDGAIGRPGGGNLVMQGTNRAPEICINIDYFDHIQSAKDWYGLDQFGANEIAGLMKRCRENGASMINWRCFSQLANYRSKIEYNMSQALEIRSGSDDRRSEGAFSVKIGVKSLTNSFGGIIQKSLIRVSEGYVFSGDILSGNPGAFLALLDPQNGKVLQSSRVVVSPVFQPVNMKVVVNADVLPCVLSKGSPDIHVFLADNLSLSDGTAEHLSNGGMEEVWQLLPIAWAPTNAAFVTLNGDYRLLSDENKKKYFPNGAKWFAMTCRPTKNKPIVDIARRTFESCDPLLEAVTQAHSNGLQFYAGWDVLDEGRITIPPSPTWRSKFGEEHPEYRGRASDGRTHWGMLCFGYPEVRAYKTELLKELLSYGVDGVMLRLNYQHNQAWDGNVYNYEDFLQSPVALAEYVRRKGKPGAAGYDINELQKIWGDFFITWLREIRPLFTASGKRLCIYRRPGQRMDATYGSWIVDSVAIVKEKLIDDLYFKIPLGDYKDYFSVIDSEAGYSRACRENNVRIGFDYYLNGLVEGHSIVVKDKGKGPYMESQLVAIAEEPVDFVGIYEAIYLDLYKFWPWVKSASARISHPDFKRKSGKEVFFDDPFRGRKNLAGEPGVSAVIITNERKSSAYNLIEGEISDDSCSAIAGLPFEVEIDFGKPITVSAVRIFPGMTAYAKNPSGVCGLKAFSIQGYYNGQWIELVPPETNAPGYDHKLIYYNWARDFSPAMIEKIRLRVITGSDTGLRMNRGDKPVVEEKNRVVYVREIQVF